MNLWETYDDWVSAQQHRNNTWYDTLYVISHRRSQRVCHVTTKISVARSLMDQEYGQLRMSLNHKKGLPTDFDMSRPWLAVCDRYAKVTMSEFTDSDLAIYQLLSHRYWAMDLLYHDILRQHIACLGHDLPHQQKIYAAKASQAQLVLTGESDHSLTYHVHDWADISGLDLESAARDIAFQQQEDDLLLAQIEQLRLRYQCRIKAAADRAQLAEIINQFKHESTTNGNV